MSPRELLIRWSPRAVQLSSQRCQGGYPRRDDCAWYHGAWPMLRALGMVSNPYWHHAFFFQVASRYSQTTDRIAVVGTADFSMPLLISSASKAMVTVMDVCETPVALCQEVSDFLSLGWVCKQRDILGGSAEVGLYDLVLNDAFLTRFPDPEKVIVLKKIKELLKSGGRYATTIRISRASVQINGNASYMSPEDRREWFVERAMARWHEVGGIDGISYEQANALASKFMREMASFRFRSHEHIIEIADAAGFAVDELSDVIVPGESEETHYTRTVMRSL